MLIQKKSKNGVSNTIAKQDLNNASTLSTNEDKKPLVYMRGEVIVITDPNLLNTLDPFYGLCAEVLKKRGQLVIEGGC